VDGNRFGELVTATLCYIDKSSSAELSEVINSMFRWYQNAIKCYISLSDVSMVNSSSRLSFHGNQLLVEVNGSVEAGHSKSFLLHSSVEFFSPEGVPLGGKQSLESQIQQITGNAVQTLRGDTSLPFSVEERMSWADKRRQRRKKI
jgi:hypothetical protein